MKSTWRNACEEMPAVVKEISRHITNYSYDSSEDSQSTEERMDAFIKEAGETMADRMHVILNVSFELHRKQLDDDARRFMDLVSSLEVYSTDSPAWNKMPLEFMKKLVMKDSVIVLGTVQMLGEIESLNERFHQAIKDDKIFAKEAPGMKKMLKDLIESLENLIGVLREREKLRNVRGECMKKAIEAFEREA
ncbi:MAG: hypothetical protein ABIH90_02530 [Candidatus Aenigmatarchaeota archaeon]